MSGFQTLSITEVVPGMFVERVTKQKGNMQIKSRGLITSQAVIEKLKRDGILEVEVDPSKQKFPESSKPSEPKDVEPQEPEIQKTNFEQESKRATKLYENAKVLQNKFLKACGKDITIDIKQLEQMSNELVDSIDRNSDALMCLTSIREKDEYLLEHSINVGILLATFAKHLEYPPEFVKMLAFAGTVHDIGKIKVPDEVLNKPGKLTDEEFVEMRNHVVYGGNYLDKFPDLNPAVKSVVMQHHEKLDGTGYPEGLDDSEISKFGRMIAIVDSYDAMTADRCYKSGMPSMKAIKILLKDSGSHFDAELVKQFANCIGIYPVGSLVLLESQKLAVVTEKNPGQPLKPKLRAFYSTRGNHYIPAKDFDLSASHCREKIKQAVKAEEYKIDFSRYYKETLAS